MKDASLDRHPSFVFCSSAKRGGSQEGVVAASSCRGRLPCLPVKRLGLAFSLCSGASSCRGRLPCLPVFSAVVAPCLPITCYLLPKSSAVWGGGLSPCIVRADTGVCPYSWRSWLLRAPSPFGGRQRGGELCSGWGWGGARHGVLPLRVGRSLATSSKSHMVISSR